MTVEGAQEELVLALMVWGGYENSEKALMTRTIFALFYDLKSILFINSGT
jgi:hypothetical protein